MSEKKRVKNNDKRAVKVPPILTDNGESELLEAVRELMSAADKISEARALKIDDIGGREVISDRGKIAKRIRAYLKREHSIDLSGEQVSALGNIAYQNSSARGAYAYEYDDIMSLECGEFYDDNSCFYLEYGCGNNFHHRIAMSKDKSDRFRAVKFYDESGKKIARCFAFMASDNGIVLYNAYGREILKLASIVARGESADFKQVRVKSDMWINDKCGNIAGNGGVNTWSHYCYSIGGTKSEYHFKIKPSDYFNDSDEYGAEYESECAECGESFEYHHNCDECNERLCSENTYYIGENCEQVYCEQCQSECSIYCECCEQDYYRDNVEFYKVRGEQYYDHVCEYCRDDKDRYRECCECGEHWSTDSINEMSGESLCDECLDLSGECSICEALYYPLRESESGREYCEQCGAAAVRGELKALRASASKCAECEYTDYGDILYECYECRRQINYDCNECRESALNECAYHYSLTAHYLSAAQRERLNYSLYCDKCGTMSGEQVRRAVRDNRGREKCESLCVNCFAKFELMPSIRSASAALLTAREYSEVIEAARAFNECDSDNERRQYISGRRRGESFYHYRHYPNSDRLGALRANIERDEQRARERFYTFMSESALDSIYQISGELSAVLSGPLSALPVPSDNTFYHSERSALPLKISEYESLAALIEALAASECELLECFDYASDEREREATNNYQRSGEHWREYEHYCNECGEQCESKIGGECSQCEAVRAFEYESESESLELYRLARARSALLSERESALEARRAYHGGRGPLRCECGAYLIAWANITAVRCDECRESASESERRDYIGAHVTLNESGEYITRAMSESEASAAAAAIVRELSGESLADRLKQLEAQRAREALRTHLIERITYLERLLRECAYDERLAAAINASDRESGRGESASAYYCLNCEAMSECECLCSLIGPYASDNLRAHLSAHRDMCL